jgi:DNA-binding response OmpR family regulator
MREGYVLVVDDEAPTREFLRHWLETMGYPVKQAPSADIALATLLHEPAAIVLLDIDMPGHDGLWLAERVRNSWPSTAIVFASGVDKIETIERARWLGAVDYVQKPFQWEMVAQAMRRAADRVAGSAATET